MSYVSSYRLNLERILAIIGAFLFIFRLMPPRPTTVKKKKEFHYSNLFRSFLVVSDVLPCCASSRSPAATLNLASPGAAKFGMIFFKPTVLAAALTTSLRFVPKISCLRWIPRGGFTIESTKAIFVFWTPFDVASWCCFMFWVNLLSLISSSRVHRSYNSRHVSISRRARDLNFLLQCGSQSTSDSSSRYGL